VGLRKKIEGEICLTQVISVPFDRSFTWPGTRRRSNADVKAFPGCKEQSFQLSVVRLSDDSPQYVPLCECESSGCQTLDPRANVQRVVTRIGVVNQPAQAA